MIFYAFEDTIQKPAIITPWSIVHFLAGVVLYCYAKYLCKGLSSLNAVLVMLFIHTVYEIKDLMMYIGFTSKNNYFTNNSLTNSIGDTIFALLGALVVIMISPKLNRMFLFTVTAIWIFLAFICKYYRMG